MVCCIEFIQSLGFQIVVKVSHLPSTLYRANVHFSDNFSASGLYNSIQHTVEVVYSQIKPVLDSQSLGVGLWLLGAGGHVTLIFTGFGCGQTCCLYNLLLINF